MPFYGAATPEDVRREIQDRMDASIEGNDDTVALTPLGVTFLSGEIQLFRRFRVRAPAINFPSAEINLSASIVRNANVPLANLQEACSDPGGVDEDDLPFGYRPFRVNASPGIPLATPALAAAWLVAEALFEHFFAENVRRPLIVGFNKSLFKRIFAANEAALGFLREARINTREFALGFCIPRLSVPALSPLITNEFLEDPLATFEIIDDPRAASSAPSVWTYDSAGQRIVQTSNIHGPDGDVNTRPDKPGTYLVGVDEGETITLCDDPVQQGGPWPAMRDFVMESTLSSRDDDGIGLVFRFVDRDNFYFFLMDAQRRYRRIGKKVNGVFRDLQNAALDTGAGTRLNPVTTSC